MVCQFCGSTLDDNEFECPYCGHKTGIEPQRELNYERDQIEYEEDTSYEESSRKHNTNSYVEQNEYESDYEEEEPVQRTARKQPTQKYQNFAQAKPSSTNSIGSLPVLIGIAACAIISLISLVNGISVKSKIENMEQNMLSQMYQLQSANNDLANSITSLGGDISSVSTTISEANDSKNITITRSPSSDATYLNRGSDDDVSQNSPLFYAEATGAIQSVEWQVKENGEWVPLSWDKDSNNLTYGLHVYNDIGPSAAKSQLCSHGVTSMAFDKQYRCVFKDSYGSKATEVATLSQREA